MNANKTAYLRWTEARRAEKIVPDGYLQLVWYMINVAVWYVYDKSCGTRGGGSSSVIRNDSSSVIVKLESMMYGQNRQTASEARFSDNQLVIITKSDLTGTSRICLSIDVM